MKHLVIGVLLALSLLGGCIERSSQAFERDLERFLLDAAKLQALTEQGVSKDRFADQLATVSADFEIAERKWPNGHPAEARLELQKAILGWRLALRLWDRQLQDKSDETTDQSLIEIIRTYAPRRVVLGQAYREWNPTEAPSTLNYRKNLRILLSEASNHFNAARKALP